MSQKPLKDRDADQVLRTAYDEKTGAININKVNSLVPTSYGKVELDYTTVAGQEVISTATFYGDGESQVTQVRTYSDVAGSLNNTYFFIWSTNNVTKYHVWFNNGTGIDPAPPASTPIEVVYVNNDDRVTLANLIVSAVNQVIDFAASNNNAQVLINNLTQGTATSAVDNNTGFKIKVLRSGVARKIVTILSMGYDVNANLTSAERTYYDA